MIECTMKDLPEVIYASLLSSLIKTETLTEPGYAPPNGTKMDELIKITVKQNDTVIETKRI